MELARYLLILLTAVAMMAAPQAKEEAPAKGAATKAAPAAEAQPRFEPLGDGQFILQT